MFQDTSSASTPASTQPMNHIDLGKTAIRSNGYQPYHPTYVPTSLPAPGPDLLTLSVIGANLMFVAPFAYAVWSCSLFAPKVPARMPNVV